MESKFKSDISSTNKLSNDVNLSYKELSCAVMDNPQDASVELEVKTKNGKIEKNELNTSGLSEITENMAKSLQATTEKYLTATGGDGDVKVEIKLSRKI